MATQKTKLITPERISWNPLVAKRHELSKNQTRSLTDLFSPDKVDISQAASFLKMVAPGPQETERATKIKNAYLKHQGKTYWEYYRSNPNEFLALSAELRAKILYYANITHQFKWTDADFYTILLQDDELKNKYFKLRENELDAVIQKIIKYLNGSYLQGNTNTGFDDEAEFWLKIISYDKFIELAKQHRSFALAICKNPAFLSQNEDTQKSGLQAIQQHYSRDLEMAALLYEQGLLKAVPSVKPYLHLVNIPQEDDGAEVKQVDLTTIQIQRNANFIIRAGKQNGKFKQQISRQVDAEDLEVVLYDINSPRAKEDACSWMCAYPQSTQQLVASDAKRAVDVVVKLADRTAEKQCDVAKRLVKAKCFNLPAQQSQLNHHAFGHVAAHLNTQASSSQFNKFWKSVGSYAIKFKKWVRDKISGYSTVTVAEDKLAVQQVMRSDKLRGSCNLVKQDAVLGLLQTNPLDPVACAPLITDRHLWPVVQQHLQRLAHQELSKLPEHQIIRPGHLAGHERDWQKLFQVHPYAYAHAVNLDGSKFLAKKSIVFSFALGLGFNEVDHTPLDVVLYNKFRRQFGEYYVDGAGRATLESILKNDKEFYAWLLHTGTQSEIANKITQLHDKYPQLIDGLIENTNFNSFEEVTNFCDIHSSLCDALTSETWIYKIMAVASGSELLDFWRVHPESISSFVNAGAVSTILAASEEKIREIAEEGQAQLKDCVLAIARWCDTQIESKLEEKEVAEIKHPENEAKSTKLFVSPVRVVQGTQRQIFEHIKEYPDIVNELAQKTHFFEHLVQQKDILENDADNANLIALWQTGKEEIQNEIVRRVAVDPVIFETLSKKGDKVSKAIVSTVCQNNPSLVMARLANNYPQNGEFKEEIKVFVSHLRSNPALVKKLLDNDTKPHDAKTEISKPEERDNSKVFEKAIVNLFKFADASLLQDLNDLLKSNNKFVLSLILLKNFDQALVDKHLTGLWNGVDFNKHLAAEKLPAADLMKLLNARVVADNQGSPRESKKERDIPAEVRRFVFGSEVAIGKLVQARYVFQADELLEILREHKNYLENEKGAAIDLLAKVFVAYCQDARGKKRVHGEQEVEVFVKDYNSSVFTKKMLYRLVLAQVPLSPELVLWLLNGYLDAQDKQTVAEFWQASQLVKALENIKDPALIFQLLDKAVRLKDKSTVEGILNNPKLAALLSTMAQPSPDAQQSDGITNLLNIVLSQSPLNDSRGKALNIIRAEISKLELRLLSVGSVQGDHGTYEVLGFTKSLIRLLLDWRNDKSAKDWDARNILTKLIQEFSDLSTKLGLPDETDGKIYIGYNISGKSKEVVVKEVQEEIGKAQTALQGELDKLPEVKPHTYTEAKQPEQKVPVPNSSKLTASSLSQASQPKPQQPKASSAQQNAQRAQEEARAQAQAKQKAAELERKQKEAAQVAQEQKKQAQQQARAQAEQERKRAEELARQKAQSQTRTSQQSQTPPSSASQLSSSNSYRRAIVAITTKGDPKITSSNPQQAPGYSNDASIGSSYASPVGGFPRTKEPQSEKTFSSVLSSVSPELDSDELDQVRKMQQDFAEMFGEDDTIVPKNR